MGDTPHLVFLCSKVKADQSLLAALENHLAVLALGGAITLWHEGLITGGRPLEEEWQRNLDAADLLLPLISGDFFAMDHPWSQRIDRAMRRRPKPALIPILLRPIADWQVPPIPDVVPLPSTGQPITSWRKLDDALAAVAKGLSAWLRERNNKLRMEKQGKTLAAPQPPRDGTEPPSALQHSGFLSQDPGLATFQKSQHTFVLGEYGDDATAGPSYPTPQSPDRRLLRQRLRYDSQNEAVLPLASLSQRNEIREGQQVLRTRYDQAMLDASTVAVPLVLRMAEELLPGLQISLLWLPQLELALAAARPNHNVWALYPAQPGETMLFYVVRRAERTTTWESVEFDPAAFDLARDYVVLRLQGGRTPIAEIQADPVVTEDHHIEALTTIRNLPDRMLAYVRFKPLLFVGMSVLDWTHRALVRRLLLGMDPQQQRLSRALVPKTTPPKEQLFWRRVLGVEPLSLDLQPGDATAGLP